jgi:beta-glucanase (GH16 family)
MNYLKKLIICAFVFFSLQTINAQSFPYKSATDNTGSNVTSAYTLVWQDNFDGNTLDETNNWGVEVNGDGGGNAELQYYRRENISVGVEPVSGANCLIITGKKESFSGKTCTSGRLRTSGKMSFKHGKIEARIKLPHTANGLWPAFWMMGQDYPTVGWPKCGEIDIMEMGNTNGINRGTQDRYFSSWFHWGETWKNYPNWGKDYTNSTGIQDDFCLFTLIWDDNSLKTYYGTDDDPLKVNIVEMAINGADVINNAAHYFHKQFYVIFNLAIGGNFTGIHDINNVTALANGDVKMYVDYVRVYQQGVTGEEYTGPALVPTGINELKVQNQYRIYPNPATDRINIEGNIAPTRVLFVNMSGQEIRSVSDTKFVDISTLPSGNYLLKVEDANGRIETHKLTKK